MKLPTSFGKPNKANRLALRRVVGGSMLPTLRPGQLVWLWRTAKISRGDLVVFEQNGLEKIKRIQEIHPDQVFVVGDNLAASTDSRDFGWIDRSQLRAKVIKF